MIAQVAQNLSGIVELATAFICLLLTAIGALVIWILTGIRGDIRESNEDRDEIWRVVNQHLIDCAKKPLDKYL